LCASPLNESTTSSADTKSARTRESLWRQLILIVNSFVIKLIQQRKYPLAIDLLDTAKNLLLYLDVKTCKNTIDELSGFIKNSFAYYYSKRDKPSAALQYIIEATTIQRRRKDTLNIVRCNLYRSFILQQLNRYCEAMKLLKVVLKMVHDGSLDSLYKSSMSASSNGNNKNMFLEANDNDPQIVLLVAVTYHNLCCLQLIKGQIGDACMNSQNCRKLCRLCMNISNRYVIHFEETHMKAMNELFGIICPKQTEKEAIVFQRMFAQLFSNAQ
jgi:tetratricopeptide (TPR) repeat protein